MPLWTFMGAGPDGRPLPAGRIRVGRSEFELAPLDLEKYLQVSAILRPRAVILRAFLTTPDKILPEYQLEAIRVICEALDVAATLPLGPAPSVRLTWLERITKLPANEQAATIKAALGFYLDAHDWSRLIEDLAKLRFDDDGELVEEERRGSPNEVLDAMVTLWLRSASLSIYAQMRMRPEAWLDLRESIDRIDNKADPEANGDVAGPGEKPRGKVVWIDPADLGRFAGLPTRKADPKE